MWYTSEVNLRFDLNESYLAKLIETEISNISFTIYVDLHQYKYADRNITVDTNASF